MSPETIFGVRKLRKCIATVALSGTLPDKLETAAAVGFHDRFFFEAVQRSAGYAGFGAANAPVRAAAQARQHPTTTAVL